MPIKPGERCECCYKHINPTSNVPAHPPPACELCLPPNESLKTCNRCKLVRYCGRDCQKTHWPNHKESCQVQVDLRDAAKLLGKDIEEKQASFFRWCDRNALNFAGATFHALGIHSPSDRERLHNYAFLITVEMRDITAAGSSSHKFAHSISAARQVSMGEMHLRFDSRFERGASRLEEVLSPSPGMMRILVQNTTLPPPLDLYTVPVEVAEGSMPDRYDPHWFERLKEQAK